LTADLTARPPAVDQNRRVDLDALTDDAIAVAVELRDLLNSMDAEDPEDVRDARLILPAFVKRIVAHPEDGELLVEVYRLPYDCREYRVARAAPTHRTPAIRHLDFRPTRDRRRTPRVARRRARLASGVRPPTPAGQRSAQHIFRQDDADSRARRHASC